LTVRRRAATVLVIGAVLAGCSGSSSAPTSSRGARTPPDISGLLRLPVATPSSCASQPAESTGLRSPWSGHVDVSVFLEPGGRVAQIRRLLDDAAISQRVYFESRREAYAEFQRLYTCWADVPRSAIPPSLRVVLRPTATIAQRDSLVARLVRQEGVDSVSCDPSLPCTEVVQTAAAQRR
jgi:hypothetical protein